MSNNDSTLPPSPALALTRPAFHVHHDKGSVLQFRHRMDVQDALNNCCANLALLGDLFTAPAEQVELFNCDPSRWGMYRQLMSIAGTLEAIEAYLGSDDELAAKDEPETAP